MGGRGDDTTRRGLSVPFSTVPISRFGLGPQTSKELNTTMLVFASATSCGFAILVAMFEGPMCPCPATMLPGNELNRFEMQLSSSRPFGRRGEDRK